MYPPTHLITTRGCTDLALQLLNVEDIELMQLSIVAEWGEGSAPVHSVREISNCRVGSEWGTVGWKGKEWGIVGKKGERELVGESGKERE